MKKILRSFLLICISLFGIAWVYRVFMCTKPLVRVLVFHDVMDSVWFRNTVRFLSTQYHLLTPEDFVARKFVKHKINILLTFDDGYASWVTKVLPILQDNDCHGIFFVNSGLLDCANQDDMRRAFVRENLKLDAPRETLSWDGLRILRNAGHTIGGHARSHTRLSLLKRDAMSQEISSDKISIEQVLGETLTMFAYPFGNDGDYTEETEEMVARAGYTMAFSTTPMFVLEYSYALPRLCIEDGASSSQIQLFISGAYDVFHKIKRLCVR